MSRARHIAHQVLSTVVISGSWNKRTDFVRDFYALAHAVETSVCSRAVFRQLLLDRDFEVLYVLRLL